MEERTMSEDKIYHFTNCAYEVTYNYSKAQIEIYDTFNKEGLDIDLYVLEMLIEEANERARK
jgi:hypothetical protein